MVFLEPGDPAILTSRLAASFADTFSRVPAVVARAPGRVNLIGEHTDYNAGLCLPVALPHATYAALARRDDGVVRVASRQRRDGWSGRLADVAPGSVDGWAAYVVGVLWALRDDVDLGGCDVLVDSTVPIGAGLSSSAALECSVAAAVAAVGGLSLDDDRVRRRLVQAAMRAESDFVGAPTGGMDQTVAMVTAPGAALRIDFADGSTRPVPLDLDGLELLVTDTRVAHALVDGGYADRRRDCEAAAARLGVASLRDADPVSVAALTDDRLRRRAQHVVSEIARVDIAVAAFGARDLVALGETFAASHASMRDDFEISCPELDLAVGAALAGGATAARMTGGGFGGSIVSIVETRRVGQVVAQLDDAFSGRGYRRPQHLLVQPGGPASTQAWGELG
ncbi:MAG: galactokinase [Actinobacteria bacterium]|uniref:Unannotated protein n=1 Tax=freshwater metagenome TaxID=449393 RepID=A0A6J6R358_9ZZZZ|nr:galactokinase [Actinomycetota bacterium]